MASLFECHLNIDLVLLFKREGANQSCIANIRLQTDGKSDVAVIHQSYQNECCHRPIVFHCRSLHVCFVFMYLQLSLSLEHGVGVSLINSVPEELLFATFSGVRVSVCSLPLCVVYG